MLIVATIAKIRRLSLVQGKSIKAICRELKISRKVVRKVLRSDETEFRYERKHQPYPQMGAWREKLDLLLSVNATKSQRERLTLIRIYEELRGRGYPLGPVASRIAPSRPPPSSRTTASVTRASCGGTGTRCKRASARPGLPPFEPEL
jgi:hypothetical protein